MHLIPGTGLSLPTLSRSTVLLLVCMNSAGMHGQSLSFTDPNATWYVADTYPNGGPLDPGFTETRTTAYGYAGDSVTAGFTWMRMASYPLGDTTGVQVFESLVRQSGDLVLALDDAGVVDTLYDFGLEIGSSITYELEGATETVAVSTVDSIQLAGIYHRVITFQTFTGSVPDFLAERWIEGIGSIHGPLFPSRPRTFSTEVPGDSLMLTCYAQDGTLLWQHTGYPACATNILLGTDDMSAFTPALSPWPNPGTDHFILSLPPGPHMITVLDATGRPVLEQRTTGDRTSFTTDRLPPGLYRVVVNTNGRTQHVAWCKE